MILREINKEINDFKNRQIQIVPSLFFNQYETLQQIYFYYNSKYKTGEVDADGDRKYFHNINRNPCKVGSKSIDFDTKNIRLLTTEGGDSLKTWFMERDLKFWMRDKQFGKVLNRIFMELPIYGSVVLKIIDGTPMFVDLRNFVIEQSADTLEQANYITEIHNYTQQEFKSVAKKMGWEKKKIDEVIELFHQMKDTSHIRLYERYGEDLFRQGFSYIPQRTVSENTKGVALRISGSMEYGITGRASWIKIIVESHDALLVSVPINRRFEAANILREEFERPINFSKCSLPRGQLIIPCEIESGYNYKDLSKFKWLVEE